MLSKTEKLRYQKHLFLSEIGENGQEKLKNAKVLVVGAGGLGCPVLLYLVAAGIGNIGIVDGDKVDMSNLQRQVIYEIKNIGLPKAEAAKKHLLSLNNEIEINVFAEFLKSENAAQIISKYDIVVDCTDNFTVRYLINDHCVRQRKAFVYGAIHKFEGQVSVFNYKDKEGVFGPTYRCLFPNKPSDLEIPNCAEVGVLGVLPGTIGLYQANEVIKIILGIGKVLSGQLLIIDLLENIQHKVKIKRNGNAEASIFPDENKDDNNQIIITLTSLDLNKKIAKGDIFTMLDVRQPWENELCQLPNSILIPLNELPEKYNNIPRNNPILVYCHHGMRSAAAIQYLQQKGFENLINLEGGIEEWAITIDLKMARY